MGSELGPADNAAEDAEEDKADAGGIADAEDEGDAEEDEEAKDDTAADEADAEGIADAEDDKEAEGVAEDNVEEVRSADSTPDAGFVPVRDFVLATSFVPATGFFPVRDFVPVTGFVPATDFDVFGRGFFRTDQPKWPSASPSAKYSPWE